MSYTLPIDGNRNAVPALRPGTTERVATSTASAASAAVTASSIVRVISSTDVFLAVGTNPTATTSSMLLPANTPEYIKLNTGDRIAAILSTGSGYLYVTAVS